MKFFYSAGAMGYSGEGYWWHRFFNFPKLPFVTKTITFEQIKGNKYFILPFFNSVFNRVCLSNIGLYDFIKKYGTDYNDRTVSLAGTDHDFNTMLDFLYTYRDTRPILNNIELNFSCPNAKRYNNNRLINDICKSVYLKLNYTQDPYAYDLDRVKGIRVNSIPLKFCGGSGKIAQKKNWKFIEKFNKEGLNVAGCSAQSFDDIKRLKDIGCTEIGIGSTMLTNPKFVEKLNRVVII